MLLSRSHVVCGGTFGSLGGLAKWKETKTHKKNYMSKYSSTNSDHNQKTMDVKTHEVLKLFKKNKRTRMTVAFVDRAKVKRQHK